MDRNERLGQLTLYVPREQAQERREAYRRKRLQLVPQEAAAARDAAEREGWERTRARWAVEDDVRAELAQQMARVPQFLCFCCTLSL